jgi:hypothetical protein
MVMHCPARMPVRSEPTSLTPNFYVYSDDKRPKLVSIKVFGNRCIFVFAKHGYMNLAKDHNKHVLSRSKYIVLPISSRNVIGAPSNKMADRVHISNMCSHRLLERAWNADPYLKEVFATFVRDSSSIARQIENAPTLKRWFKASQCRAKVKIEASVCNLRAAKHRFESWIKPLGRFFGRGALGLVTFKKHFLAIWRNRAVRMTLCLQKSTHSTQPLAPTPTPTHHHATHSPDPPTPVKPFAPNFGNPSKSNLSTVSA